MRRDCQEISLLDCRVGVAKSCVCPNCIPRFFITINNIPPAPRDLLIPSVMLPQMISPVPLVITLQQTCMLHVIATQQHGVRLHACCLHAYRTAACVPPHKAPTQNHALRLHACCLFAYWTYVACMHTARLQIHSIIPRVGSGQEGHTSAKISVQFTFNGEGTGATPKQIPLACAT